MRERCHGPWELRPVEIACSLPTPIFRRFPIRVQPPAPLYPVAHTDPATNPLIDLRNWPVVLADPKVRHRSRTRRVPRSRRAPQRPRGGRCGEPRGSEEPSPGQSHPDSSELEDPLQCRHGGDRLSLVARLSPPPPHLQEPRAHRRPRHQHRGRRHLLRRGAGHPALRGVRRTSSWGGECSWAGG